MARTERGGRVLPLISVRARTYREAGEAIGARCREGISALVEQVRAALARRGIEWSDHVAAVAPYLEAGRTFDPRYVEELEGVASGAGIPFPDLFAVACQEDPSRVAPAPRGCTDFVATPAATGDGTVLACHNEDVAAGWEPLAAILRLQVADEPEFLASCYAGIVPTTGFNEAGISLTGNALEPNDVRVGVPKIFAVRRALASRHLGEALRAAVPPGRASSYNNILATSDGLAYSVEGSATDFELLPLEDEGFLVHTNHYVAPRMRRYEADPAAVFGSVIRYDRARQLVREHLGRLSRRTAQAILADHAHAPYSLCRHLAEGSGTGWRGKTVFSVIVELTRLTLWACWGNPCEGEFVPYRLASDEKAETREAGA